MYKNFFGKPLPQNLLIVPVQYLLFNQCYYCTFLLKIEEEIGHGAFKRVEKTKVIDIIGSIPSPEIYSLKGTHLALYRPRKCSDLFINDIKDIIKLDELYLQNYAIKGHVSRIIGHSLFLPPNYQQPLDKYTRLIEEKALKENFHFDDVLFSFHKSIESVMDHESAKQVAKEILDHNDLINIPYMFSSFLPYNLITQFTKMNTTQILQNIYAMVAMISFYAAEGIYFRDLCPDNFRLNDNIEVKLIDPSYVPKNIRKSQRYQYFLRQTTPEYLPNEFTLLSRQSPSSVISYFGQFPEGVCIGMLEKVIKRIFLSKYIKETYSNFSDIEDRVEKSHHARWQEDIDLFKDIAEKYEEKHFLQYRKNIYERMLKENWPQEASRKISHLLEILRKFSKPVMKGIQCHSYLKEEGVPMNIYSLPSFAANIMNISPREERMNGRFLNPIKTSRNQTETTTRRAKRMLIKQSDVENYIRRKTKRTDVSKIETENQPPK